MATSDRPGTRKSKLIRGLLLFSCIFALIVVARFIKNAYALGSVDSAIASLRTIVNAEGKFANAHPEIGYTCDPSKLEQTRLSGMISSSRNNGYAVAISGCSAMSNKRPNRKYQVTTRPLHENIPAFCTDQSGIN